MGMNKILLNDMVNMAFKVTSTLVDCDCMALRIKDDNGDYPFYKYIGYKKDFIEKENSILNTCKGASQLECLCGKIVKGNIENIDDLVTSYGSISVNLENKALLNKLGNILESYRGECIEQGFKHCALIPLRSEDDCNGLLHLSSYDCDSIKENEICKIEELAKYLSQFINKIKQISTHEEKKKIKVLIADDEIQIALILKRLLDKYGYEAVTANDGEEAFEYISNNRIDLLISDIKMPKLSGMQLIRKIRRKYDIYGPKIIIMTGSLNSISKNFIIKNNIRQIISKPFEDIMEIPEIIGKMFARESEKCN
jgi:CheY-like chemotaxis protein